MIEQWETFLFVSFSCQNLFKEERKSFSRSQTKIIELSISKLQVEVNACIELGLWPKRDRSRADRTFYKMGRLFLCKKCNLKTNCWFYSDLWFKVLSQRNSRLKEINRKRQTRERERDLTIGLAFSLNEGFNSAMIKRRKMKTRHFLFACFSSVLLRWTKNIRRYCLLQSRIGRPIDFRFSMKKFLANSGRRSSPETIPATWNSKERKLDSLEKPSPTNNWPRSNRRKCTRFRWAATVCSRFLSRWRLDKHLRWEQFGNRFLRRAVRLKLWRKKTFE